MAACAPAPHRVACSTWAAARGWRPRRSPGSATTCSASTPRAAPIDAAVRHAAGSGLAIAYRVATAETLVAEGLRFPVVTALEVIEHVADPARFLATLAALLEPGGLLFVSTLNRTARSLAVAKLGAEYVARLLPTGTHDWRRFISPAELDRAGRPAGLRLAATCGMRFDLRTRTWRGSPDLSINYLALLERR